MARCASCKCSEPASSRWRRKNSCAAPRWNPARGLLDGALGRVKSRPMVPARFDDFGEIVVGDANEVAMREALGIVEDGDAVSYTHLRAHETVLDLVCRLLLEKKK